MKKYDVFGIGSALMDFLVEIDNDSFSEFELKHGDMQLVEESKASEILDKLKNHEVKIAPGGSSANTVAGVAFLGGKSIFFGMVGEDDNGVIYEQKMISEGVKSAIVKTKESITGHAVTFITPDSQRTFATHLGASLGIKKEHILEKDIKESKILHIEGYQLADENLKEVVMHAISIAKNNGTRISIDVSAPGVVEANKELFIDFVKSYADIVFANEDEAKSLTGKGEEDALNEISDMDVEIAIVKIGERGSLIKKGNKIYKIAPLKINAVDSTGAGDMYAAGVLYGITNGLSIEDAGRLGSYAAAKVVEQVGARLSKKINIKEVLEK